MTRRVSITRFRNAISELPADPPRDRPGVWYRTQKEHWQGWLGAYFGPGAYGRQPETRRDAEFAYNHIVNYKMLLWLIDATGFHPAIVRAARRAAAQGEYLAEKAAAVRRIVPWKQMAAALWV